MKAAMHALPLRTTFALLVATLTCAWAAMQDPAPPAADQEPLTVFLVRHAEKAAGGADPALTAAGRARAAALARTLADADVEHVHSSDFVRTRDTAAPAAAALGLEVEIYDPRDLPGLAERLRASGGRHLVVGHSNTTPALVALLGGEPGPPIREKDEYDRLYVVMVPRSGAPTSTLMRYGGTGGYDPAMQVQYLEVVTPEVDATCATLAAAHGVEFGEPVAELGNARTAALAGGGRVGVRAPMHDAETPVVRPYLLVDDVAAATQAADDAGAEIAMPPTEIPGQGTFSIYVLGGIQHGLWQERAP